MVEFEDPFFLFLGQTDQDAATSKLDIAGIHRVKKKLESGIENWRSITAILESDQLTGVIGKFTNRAMRSMSTPLYYDVAHEFLGKLSQTPHIVFIHETFFEGEKSEETTDNTDNIYFDNWSYFDPLPDDIRDIVKAMLVKYDINIVPYTRNVEVSVISSTFIDEHQKNMLFRFYVPDGKMWANETKTIIDLFREYLSKAADLNIRQNQYSTGRGTVYEFFGDHSVTSEIVSKKFESFSMFMDACLIDPSQAAAMLTGTNIPAEKIEEIVTRYSKQASRLHTDLRHERERRLLSIRHRMESELSDEVQGIENAYKIAAIVDAALPAIQGFSNVLGFGTDTAQVKMHPNVTLNFGPQIIGTVNGIVAKEVSGTQNLGPEPLQIMEIIQKLGGDRKTELASAVYELEDVSQTEEVRLNASQKLKGFLIKSGEKVADLGINLLQAYIEKKLGLEA